MIDTAQWKLHGPVRTLRSELAEWDVELGIWKERGFFRSVTFDSNGRITQMDQRGAGHSTYRTTYVYDDHGRLFQEASGTVGEPTRFARRWSYDDRGREHSISVAHGDGSAARRPSATMGRCARRRTRRAFIRFASRTCTTPSATGPNRS